MIAIGDKLEVIAIDRNTGTIIFKNGLGQRLIFFDREEKAIPTETTTLDRAKRPSRSQTPCRP